MTRDGSGDSPPSGQAARVQTDSGRGTGALVGSVVVMSRTRMHIHVLVPGLAERLCSSMHSSVYPYPDAVSQVWAA